MTATSRTALQSPLCGQIQKNVEHREKEFETYDELRSVVMKWAINKQIEEKRARFDPMGLNLVGTQVGLHGRNRHNPLPILTLQEEEKAKKRQGVQFGGKGSRPMMSAINATKGGGKGFNNSYYNIKGRMKGRKAGKDSGKGCYNCGGNHVVREWPQPKKETRE